MTNTLLSILPQQNLNTDIIILAHSFAEDVAGEQDYAYLLYNHTNLHSDCQGRRRPDQNFILSQIWTQAHIIHETEGYVRILLATMSFWLWAKCKINKSRETE